MRYLRARSSAAVLVTGALVAGLVTNPIAASTAGAAASGATATYAEGPGAAPNYILPLLTGAYYSVANIEQFQRLSYRSLFWIGDKGKPVVNPQLSLASTPTYSDNNTVVNITLGKWNWSDGTPVTSRDVAFWINLLEANKKNIAFYIPGEFPDNLKSYKVTGPESVQLTLTGPVNPTWFTYDQLSQITPIPQQTWDKTSSSGAIGNYDETPAGAVQVFNFLTAQSKDIATYGTNPLWKTVDGPFELNQYQSDGYVQFKANPAYSGPDSHAIEYFVEEPFTSDTAELNVLRSGSSLDYGYLPFQDAAQSGALKAEGYVQSVWNDWGITYFVFNFHNPTVGPIFSQAYFRQAMQSLVDEQAFIKGPLNGFAVTDYGPVPAVPSTFATPLEIKGPWPYNPAKAVSMLKAHGWDVKAGGVSTCATPGSGPNECGAGISAGAKLEFNLNYDSGDVPVSEEMQGLKTDFALAGIDINLGTAPFDTLIAQAAPCKSCSWQMTNWGGGWLFGVNPYPTGDQIFGTGSGSNFSNYSSATADNLIDQTVHGTASLAAYQNYLAEQVPVLWIPHAAFEVNEVSSKLHGAIPQSPILSLNPEFWTLSS
jgi:peptide/nickel transport system substrate-binding protein